MNESVKAIKLVDLGMLAIALISYCGIALLAVHFFYAKLALILGLGLTIITLFIYGYNKIELPKFKSTILILLLLLLALLLRTNPFLYVMGAQDQGLYVNMAAYFNSHHSTVFKDNVRTDLPAPLQQPYDLFNFVNLHPHTSNGEIPGVFIKNMDQSQYEFQFYPLHPIWMAIFANLFGAVKGVWALVFFSLLSLTFFSLICYRLSNKNLAAAAFGGVLMALNPMHMFFSKFPVSEIPTMAFLLSGFYFLIVYWQDLTTEEKIQPFYLILSALLIGCTFFIRIDGFILLAWYAGLFLLCLLNRHYILKFNSLLLYFIGIASIYAVSVVYGLTYNYFYSISIYNKSFSIFLGKDWQKYLLIAGCSYTVLCFLVSQLKFKIARLDHWQFRLNQCLVFLIFLAIALAIYRSYQFAYTPAFLHKPEAMIWPTLFNGGVGSLRYAAVVVLMHYVSYVGSAFFLFALLCQLQKTPDIKNTAILLFIFTSLFYTIVAHYVVPYQYYYLRYFLPDALFAVLLMISLKLGELFKDDSEVFEIQAKIVTQP